MTKVDKCNYVSEINVIKFMLVENLPEFYFSLVKW